MDKQAWAYDKLWHACQNALFVIDFLIRGCDDDYEGRYDKERLEGVAKELRAALEYREGINERLEKPDTAEIIWRDRYKPREG